MLSGVDSTRIFSFYGVMTTLGGFVFLSYDWDLFDRLSPFLFPWSYSFLFEHISIGTGWVCFQWRCVWELGFSYRLTETHSPSLIRAWAGVLTITSTTSTCYLFTIERIWHNDILLVFCQVYVLCILLASCPVLGLIYISVSAGLDRIANWTQDKSPCSCYRERSEHSILRPFGVRVEVPTGTGLGGDTWQYDSNSAACHSCDTRDKIRSR